MKNALMVWGGWDGHEPKQCVDIFAPFLQEKGYEVRISDTLDVYLEEDYMKSLQLIVPVWTMGQITWEQEKGLLEAVAAGSGLPDGTAGWATLSATTLTISSWWAGSGWPIRAG